MSQRWWRKKKNEMQVGAGRDAKQKCQEAASKSKLLNGIAIAGHQAIDDDDDDDDDDAGEMIYHEYE